MAIEQAEVPKENDPLVDPLEPTDPQPGETPEPADDPADPVDPPNDEVIVSFGDADSPPAEEEFKGPAPAWVKELRAKNRESEKELRELRAKLAEKEAANAPAKVEKPTLAGCDFDEDEYERRLTAWHEQDRRAKAEQEAQAEQQRKAQEEYQARLTAYSAEKSELAAPDYDDAEETARSILSPTQQGMIVHAAASPAKLIYALGKHPAKAKELAAITDPVKFAFAVSKLEDKVSVSTSSTRKAPPAPEKRVSGSAPAAVSVDSKLAALEAEADRTGDRSKVIAYKRSLKAKQAA